MPDVYMTHEHPDAFLGMTKKPRRSGTPGSGRGLVSQTKMECPKCQGYGGWHLKLNAYGDGKHFDAACNQCNGWGWVSGKDAECIHDMEGQWTEMHNLRQTCKKCGIVKNYDTSG